MEIGKFNRLKVARLVDFGLYLVDNEGNEVLLPSKYIDFVPEIGDEMEVFVYTDSEDRPVATTEKPFATVGQFAFLEVTAVNRVGAFLDWGLPKDLLVPFKEQGATMRSGGIYLVYIYLDDATKRVVASSKIDKYLGNVIPRFRIGQEVTALPYKHTEIGYKCIVNNAFYGMIYENELYRPVTIGQEISAKVKYIRDDFKIDLSPVSDTSDRINSLAAEIVSRLKQNDGIMHVGDKTDPDLIKEIFACSKKDFKKAIGLLYKQKTIEIGEKAIKLTHY